MTLREVLAWGVNKPWVKYSLFSGANSNQISELIPFTVTGLPAIRSSSLPFCLRFNVSLRATLIDTLQNSTLGVWLALTQAGSPPACQSDLASPHVHGLVPRIPTVNILGLVLQRRLYQTQRPRINRPLTGFVIYVTEGVVVDKNGDAGAAKREQHFPEHETVVILEMRKSLRLNRYK